LKNKLFIHLRAEVGDSRGAGGGGGGGAAAAADGVGRNLAERSADGVHARGHRGSDRGASEGTPLLSLARSKAPARR